MKRKFAPLSGDHPGRQARVDRLAARRRLAPDAAHSALRAASASLAAREPVGISAARAARLRLVVAVDRGSGDSLTAGDADLVVDDLAELLGRRLAA